MLKTRLAALPTVEQSTTDARYWAQVERVVSVLDGWADDDVHASDVISALDEVTRDHSEWAVRAAALRVLGTRFSGHESAARSIAAATHDRVDWVAFTALQVIHEHRIRTAVPDLVRISGFPSNFTKPRYARKPVGCGAAFTKRALIHIFGSEEPGELRRLEDEFFGIAHPTATAPQRREPPEGAVLVLGGPFHAGSDDTRMGPFQMKEGDNPSRLLTLPDFWIDRTTVTNARYRRFLDDIGTSTECDHPDQQPGRSHRPAHDHDRRFNRPDLPVVGIDWYDAWSFCRWAGGMLPSEHEWEKAARGTDGRRFPWGDEWDTSLVNYVERSYGRKVYDLPELESLLVETTSDSVPADPVLPADCLPGGASPYGALQMSGNVWELTRTNYFTSEDMDPFFRGRHPQEFMNRKDAFHVLRGGTWTSPPVCLTTYYRGKDLITDQHNEVGFRCMYRAD